ncbi:MAG: penicillin-binding transpeptidase domain-containing protein [Akkermansiaceae bacterium]|nr:penicillin-binding transpeptidase domain-containing protein [Akkermansiaceae bacterium]
MLQKLVLIGLSITLCASAQETTEAPLLVKPNLPPSNAPEEEEKRPAASNGSVFNQGLARTMSIAIPAPRGLILDRDGRPLAQTKMAYHIALDFTAYNGPIDPKVAATWAQTKIAQANALVDGNEAYSDSKLANYYKNRRWLPRRISKIISESKAKSLESKMPKGLSLLPVYQRFYPEKGLAAHLIGYVGAKTVLPTGPINDGDPLFHSVMGKSGFEQIFDQKLTGEPGLNKMIFDKNGEKILNEPIKRPRPGGNVVTTLDLDWQRYAEQVLREDCKRGAFVVIDIQSGEVLVMASRPTFDLNEFIPYITTERYKELQNNPSAPLFGRAFQSSYPPASTFKPVVALAAINNGSIHPDQTFDCPYKIKIGRKWFHNHSEGYEGWVDAKRALAKSINPWFYQVGIETGPQAFLSVARRLGFGSKTGLPLIGEATGNAPTADYIVRKMGRATTNGDTANLSIGQGLMLASPLQVAQSMAAIGNGNVLMELQLVRQIQDFHGRVIEAPTFKKRNDLNLSPIALETTHDGMRDVVHASYGTGQRANLGFTTMCGKTGTAQWKDDPKQGLAWFSGFFPYDNPRYAFAAVYEGAPGEIVGGGRKAAPMVSRFFLNFQTEIEENLMPAARAMIISEEDGQPIIPEDMIPKAIVVEDEEALLGDPTHSLATPSNNEIPVDIPRAIIVEDEEALLSNPAIPAPPQGLTETPADLPEAIPVIPADNPSPKPPLPTVPSEEIIPEAIPVKPEIPSDTPRKPPEAPGDR